MSARLAGDPAIAGVASYYDGNSAEFVSRDGRSTFVAASLKPISSSEQASVAERIERTVGREAGVELGGALIANEQVNTQIEHDLVRAELLAFPLLFLLSLLVFRGLIAALLPPIGGLVAIFSTLLCLRILNTFTPLSVFAVNLVTGLGLGLAIDYSLFIVSRYREELARFGPGREALRRTMATAGRTVLFSSLTVAVALAALLVFPQPFLYSMGIGGILGAAFAGAYALIVLPAILAVLGSRVNALAPFRARHGLELRDDPVADPADTVLAPLRPGVTQPTPVLARPPQHVPALVVKSGPLARSRFPVDPELSLGREGTDLTIDLAEISRRHAVVRTVAGELLIEDAGSLNGTFVNGSRIAAPTRLEHGDVIALGPILMVVDDPDMPHPKTAVTVPTRTPISESSGFWYRLSQIVMRRAALFAAGSAAFLIALGIPFLGVEFTGVDASVLPSSASARRVSDALETRFPTDRTTPVFLAITAPRSAAAQLDSFAAQLRALPGAAAVGAPQSLAANTWRIDVHPRQAPLAPASQGLVRQIRDMQAPFPTRAGGQTAGFLDLQSSLRSRLPIAIGSLALVTLLVLFAMTGSLLLPLKSLLMNVLTLSATFGLLVLVFQDGRLEGVLRYTSQHALESTQPILLAAIAFALSTDYAVFLLMRIKEARDEGASNTEAVARGLQRTGRIVTSAALLFCVAVGAFSTSEIVFIKELGIGMALAVIIDATIVRALLVPSLMKLLGDWNWWAPGPLRRLHDRFGLSESEPRPSVAEK